MTLPALTDRLWTLDDPLDQKAALAVCEGIAFGRTLAEIERDPGMPPKALFLVWVMRHVEVATAFAAAREVSAFVLEDEVTDKLRFALKKAGTPAEMKALDMFSNWVRWMIAKRNPKVFSEKAALDVTVPIQINTSLDMGGAAGAGTKDHPNIYQLAASVQMPMAEVQAMEDAELAPKNLPRGNLSRHKRIRKPPPPKVGPQKRVLIPRIALTEADQAYKEAQIRLLQEKKRAKSERVNAYMRERRARAKEQKSGDSTQDGVQPEPGPA